MSEVDQGAFQAPDTSQVQEGSQVEQPQGSQENQVEPSVPDTLSKFQSEDGNIDNGKLQNSYVELEKALGNYKQRYGQVNQELEDAKYRLALLEQQAQTPAEPNIQPPSPGQSGNMIPEDYDSILSESDLNVFDNLVDQRVKQSVTELMDQQRRQQQAELAKRYTAAEVVFVEKFKNKFDQMSLESPDIESRRGAIEQHLLQDPEVNAKFYSFMQSGQVNDGEIESFIKSADQVVRNRKKKEFEAYAKELGIDSLQRQAANQLNNGLPAGGTDAISTEVTEEEAEMLKGWL